MQDFDRYLLSVVYDIPNFIFVVDPIDRKIVYANQFMQQTLGADCVGQLFSKRFSSAGGDHFFLSYAQQQESAASGTKAFLPPQSEYYDDETENWYHVLQRPIIWPDNTSKIVFVLNEINALKHLQKNLSEAHATLSLKNRELEQERNKAVTRSETNAILNTLVASVSHELATPIGNGVMAASTMAQLANEFARAIVANNIKRSELVAFMDSVTAGTELLQSNLGRAAELLSKFRQVAADQASEQRREFDLAEVIMEILGAQAPSLKRHPHRVVAEIPANIRMDSQPGALGQIVINLINNAYLHAFENRTAGVLIIRAEMLDEFVRLSFTDNGIGIPEDNLEKVFQPFFSTKIGKGGTGLGLSIVQNLAEKTLGGELRVSSTVGKGTCFEILLPRNMRDRALPHNGK